MKRIQNNKTMTMTTFSLVREEDRLTKITSFKSIVFLDSASTQDPSLISKNELR